MAVDIFNARSVGLKIHYLYLTESKNPFPPKRCTVYDIKQPLMVKIQFWNVNYISITIIPSFTLTRSGSTC